MNDGNNIGPLPLLTGVYHIHIGTGLGNISINDVDSPVFQNDGYIDFFYGKVRIILLDKTKACILSWMQSLHSGSSFHEAWIPIIVSIGVREFNLVCHAIHDVCKNNEDGLHFLVLSNTFGSFNEQIVLCDRRNRIIKRIDQIGRSLFIATPTITHDEWDCIYESARGMSIGEISERKKWSASKVKHLRLSIYEKLGVANMTEAISWINLYKIR